MPQPRNSAAVRARVPGSRVGTRRIENTLAFAACIFCGFYSVLSLPTLLNQGEVVGSALGLALVVLVAGSMVLATIGSILRHWTRPLFFTVSAVYAIALACWPLVLTGPLHSGEQPWIGTLLLVATTYLTMASRSWELPAIYSLVTCATFAYLRTTPWGGGVSASRAVFDGLYAVFLDLALITLAVAIRLAARSVDNAEQHALDRYAEAQSDQATERQRVQIDALVHDSVLTTFLTAAAADTAAAMALAARMARAALAQLAAAQLASNRDRPGVTLEGIAELISDAAIESRHAFTISTRGRVDEPIPADVADAAAAAVAQAMVNSVRHAGPGATRTVVAEATPTGFAVRIVDDGVGFDMASIPVQRLGVRISIIERIAMVGGAAQIESAPGAGTTITLQWPAPSVSGYDAVAEDAVHA